MHQSAARGEATPSVRRPIRAAVGSRSTVVLASAIAALLFGIIGVVGPFSVGAQSSDADNYVSRINALRSSVGVQALSVDGQLTGLAQSCAERIAAAGSLVHTSDLSAGISSSWTKLGENIGMGPQNDTIWSAFVQSAHHYANLVDPAFNRVGVGVANAGGSQWTCHRCMAVSGGSGQPAAARPPAPPRSAAPKAPPVTAPAPDPAPVVTLPPAPRPGPPPPADAVRVATVLQAMHVLSARPTFPAATPSTDAARVAAVLQAVHALSSG